MLKTLQRKPLAFGSWFHLSLEQFLTLKEYRPWKNVVDLFIAVHLFNYRSQMSQMTSKSGKNEKMAREAIAECVTGVLTTFWHPKFFFFQANFWHDKCFSLHGEEIDWVVCIEDFYLSQAFFVCSWPGVLKIFSGKNDYKNFDHGRDRESLHEVTSFVRLSSKGRHTRGLVPGIGRREWSPVEFTRWNESRGPDPWISNKTTW